MVKYDGATLGNKIKIFVTETDSGYEDGSIQAGVFAPLDELGWIQAGASNVDWWDLHNGAGTATTDLNGQSDLNDQGILSNATCTGSVCEPAANTPFPTYYGIEMLKDFTSSGDSLVSVTSSQTNLAAYASVGSSGNESVLLANEGGTPYTVNLSNSGTALSGNATVYSYDGTGGIVQTTGPANSVSVPAYSLVVVSLGTSSSSTTTTTTPSTPLQFTSVPYLNPVSCGVTISVGSQWAGGFTATVTLDNTVATTSSLAPWVWLYSWDLSWTWPAGQQITNGWNASITQTGETVNAYDTSSTALVPGSSTSFGFQGTWSEASNTMPSSVTLNGVPCSITGSSSSTTSNSGTSTTTTQAPATTSTTTTVAPTTTSTTTTSTTTTSSNSGTTSATCSVTLKVTSQWEISNGSGGFTANVTVTNNTSSVLNNWSIGWTWPSGQTIVNSWNAEISQSGSSVTAKNAIIDVTGSAPIEVGLPISPGSPEVFGLEGTWSGSNNVPTSFTLNGQPCSVATT